MPDGDGEAQGDVEDEDLEDELSRQGVDGAEEVRAHEPVGAAADGQDTEHPEQPAFEHKFAPLHN